MLAHIDKISTSNSLTYLRNFSAKQVLRRAKDPSLVWHEAADQYKVYFDVRIDAAKVQKLLTFLVDGRFLDDATQTVQVELVSYNAEVGLFGYFRFIFTVLDTGDISWDYALRTVDANPLYSPLLTAFEVLALLFLSVNVVVECTEMINAIRQMKMWEYVSSPFNWLDWTGFVMQLLAWFTWLQIQSSVAGLQLESKGDYFVLADPTSNIRPFSTNATVEYQLLELVSNIKGLADVQVDFSIYQGIVVTIFTFKVVKSLDFQPRMGLITRTLSKAGSNLVHYFVLFIFVFLGYFVVGNVIFGSQFGAMSTLPRAFESLMFMFISFDSAQFYSQMQQAVKRDGASGIEYSLYIWSFVFVNNLILLNILLAILVESYKAVAAESEEASTILADVKEALTYTFRRLTLPPNCFISDDQLIQAARAELSHCQNSFSSAQARLTKSKAALAPQQALLVGHGLSVNKKQLFSLAVQSREGCHTDASGIAHAGIPVETAMCGGNTSFDALAEDFVRRHGSDLAQKNHQMATEVQRLLVLEGQGRLIRMESRIAGLETSMLSIQELLVRLVGRDAEPIMAKYGYPARRLADSDESAYGNIVQLCSTVDGRKNSRQYLEAEALSVTVHKARALQRTDILFRCRSYCMLHFICDGRRDDIKNSFQLQYTKTVAGSNPAWNETFVLPIPTAARSLVVSVWDQDGQSANDNDDLIGSAEIELRDILNSGLAVENGGLIADWFQLKNPILGSCLQRAAVQLQVRKIPFI